MAVECKPSTFELQECGLAIVRIPVIASWGGEVPSSRTVTTNAITAADVAYNWHLMTCDQNPPPSDFGLLSPNSPDIRLFRTRKGCLGILQILEAAANTNGVTIRYNLVQEAEADHPGHNPVSSAPPLRLQFRWVAATGDTNSPADSLPNLRERGRGETLRVLREVVLDSDDIESASLTHSQTDQKELQVSLTQGGSQKLGEATAKNIGRQLAIVWDGRVISAPVVRSAITGRQMKMTGVLKDAEVQTLLDLLNHRRPGNVTPE